MTNRESEYWEVFARQDQPDQPIRHVGAVEAADSADARVFAKTLYDEFRWSEMFVIPRRAIIEVIRPA